MDVRAITLFLFVALFYQLGNGEKLKLCIVLSSHTAKRIHSICPRLVSLNSQVECVIGNDRFSCLRTMTMNNVDFTVLEPEDLVAAAAYEEYNILVTDELRLFPDEADRFKMVAIVHKDIQHVWNIKGRRLCHPGLESDSEWTKSFSMYLENWIIPNRCDADKTLLENRLAGLSNHFEAACIAGPWSADSTYDNKLKSKYKNLCAACNNPAGCYSSDRYHGREGALLCLTDNAGDIAWVRLDDAIEHFRDEHINKKEYNYLCPDGTTRPLDFNNTCVWITKPWPAVVARSEMAEKVSKLMAGLRAPQNEWESLLGELMQGYHATPVPTDTLQRPEDFLQRFSAFMSANNRATCRPVRRVRWCITSSLENRKCRWLREASIVYGIEPRISCIQETSTESCFDAIKNNAADIFVTKPELFLDARKKGLKPIVHAMPKKSEDLNRFAAVVRQDSKFKSLKDLKGAKACLPGYKNVGWNAFISTMANISGKSSDCFDENMIEHFFKDSCVIGLSDTTEDVLSNLYSLCKKVITAGNASPDISAFHCMSSGLGDVAFINMKAIGKDNANRIARPTGDESSAKYRTLCPNNTDNEECFLTWSSLSAVMAQENITDLRREEIYSMLLEMDQLFGKTFKGRIPAFSMYGVYDSNRSVIFPEETEHLQLEGSQISNIRSYSDITEDIAKRIPCSGAKNWNSFRNNPRIFIVVIMILLSTLS